MRIRVLAFTAAIGLLSMPVLAGPNTFTEHFADLDAELVERQEELSGDLDKSQKKQLKALTKARNALAKESPSLEKDLKAAGKSWKALRKAYKAEFESEDGLHDDFAGIAADLRSDVSDLVDNLNARSGNREASAEDKAESLGDKADGLLDASGDAADWGKTFKLIAKALKLARKGQKILDKADGKGGGAAGTYTADINSTAFDSANGAVEYTQGTGELQVFGTMPGEFFTITVWFSVTGVDGTGTYNFTAGNSSGAYSNGTKDFPLLPDSGSVTITTFDVDGSPRIAGTFSFQAGDETITIDVTQGSFDLTNVDVRN